MKKLISFVVVCGMLLISASNLFAQGSAAGVASSTEAVTSSPDSAAPAPEAASIPEAVSGEDESSRGALSELHYVLKEKFIEGGVPWMTPILILLIIGLAIVIERIIYLNLATTNTDKLLASVEAALANGGVDAAKEVCRNTRGPVASIFYQGLDRYGEGVDIVEKAIISYGGVQMGKLENGMIWIQLFIALAPSLGFLGTVIGMIQAFDDIAVAGDISPTIVADGMKVALLTTVFGLIVAMILQVFYNYLLNKISSLVNSMEDSSISIMDILVKYSADKTPVKVDDNTKNS
ncbi:MAG: MotA/TolQ/ExbB proton channel family protein [Bacteroidales bacterium]|jgi:biopolymer transport protein ExbB|nr:MotA/TolQ/ExbB proton channel family protein [Bacteroidales bacterium]